MKKLFLITCFIILSSCEKNEDTLVNSLIKIESFQSNNDCIDGGIYILSGLDYNNNNVLDENEITEREFICNGSDGQNGADGQKALVRVEEESPGSNCEFGGKVILVGIDLNKNNFLDDNEISNQSFICNTSSSSTNIVLIGDSLTNPYSDDLQEYLGVNYNVISRGVGGENINAIGFRQGGIQMYFENELTLPANTEPIVVGTIGLGQTSGMISDFNGGEINPLLQGGSSHINPCYVAGIECTLKWTGNAHNDVNGQFTLTRNITANKPTVLPVKTYCIPALAYQYREEVQIIFMGQNGGFNGDYQQLVNAFKKCTDYLGHGKFIVITSHINGNTTQNDLMRDEYGHKYINLNTQMSRYGLEYAGLDPNDGSWQSQLLSDDVHFNEIGQAVMAKIIGNRIKQLNY